MIRAKKVRVIGADGQHLGIITIQEALKIASSQNLDLVEIASDSEPVVCKIINFGKYKYELNRKAKESRKHQKLTIIKEIKLNPKIGEHDLLIKINQIRKFIESGNKVKITVNFKGRQMAHLEFGKIVIDKIISDLQEIAHIETPPKLEGVNMIMMLIKK